jgi:hypothetical protein
MRRKSDAESSYVLAGMASHGLAPGWLRIPAGSVPVRAVLICATVTVLFGFVSFETSIAVQAVLYGGVVVTECAAYIVKRSGDGSIVDAVGVALMPVLFTVFSFYVQNRLVLAAGLGGMLFSLALTFGEHVGRGKKTRAPEPFSVRPKRPETDRELEYFGNE